MTLHDESGLRKYLTPAERETFIKTAENAPREVRTFCWTLALTGCRISEALQLSDRKRR
jgi:integrase/recombinase XerD